MTEQLMSVLKKSTPNPGRQHPNRKAALDALAADLETGLRAKLGRFLGDAQVKTAGIVPDNWRKQMEDHLRPVIETVVSTTTAGSPLRRREAQARAITALDAVLNAKPKALQQGKTTGSQADAAPAAAGGKPRRRRGGTKGKDAAT